MVMLAKVRSGLHISQAELSRRSGLHPSTISLIEGQRFVPSPRQLEKLAVGLGFNGNPADLVSPASDEAGSRV